MFFSKRKLPITDNDREWIDSDIDWLRKAFGEDHFRSIRTVTPTKSFYSMQFDGSKEYAQFVLETTRKLMAIKDDEKVSLEFYNTETIEGSNGQPLTVKGDLYGRWNDAAGTYQEVEGGTIISLDERQLKDPISLIATISHELSHLILLGEDWIKENDEYLTDLTAIFYGFGVFLGNAKFKHLTENTGFGSAWSVSSQGYLPEQIIAYATAQLSFLRKEEINYGKYMNGQFAKHFEDTVQYLKKENS